jgi:hypothetical protein
MITMIFQTQRADTYLRTLETSLRRTVCLQKCQTSVIPYQQPDMHELVTRTETYFHSI